MKKPAGEGGPLWKLQNSHSSNDTAVSVHRVMVLMQVMGVNHETTV
jgi:hypothetical protein